MTDIVVLAERVMGASREAVFDLVAAPDAAGRSFTGYGPVPAARRSFSVDDGPLRTGSLRVVENADGSVVEEEIVALVRPERQAYVLRAGLPPSLARLTTKPSGEWTFVDVDGDTHVRWEFRFPSRSALAIPMLFVVSRLFRAAMRRCLENIARLLPNESFVVADAVEVPIDGVLDLHNFSPKDLRTLVPDYLEECRSRDVLAVRIIHGKGTGALRKSVHALLDRSPHVAGYRLAGADAGGWGATLVDLKPRES